MFKKIIKSFAVTLGLYFGYTFIRSAIYGYTHEYPIDRKTREEIAYKIATFRG